MLGVTAKLTQLDRQRKKIMHFRYFDPTRPDPTRPDPRVDPTRVHPWAVQRSSRGRMQRYAALIDGGVRDRISGDRFMAHRDT